MLLPDYQLTPAKDFCLRHCRSPIAFLLHVAAYKGRLRDIRISIHHGVYCIGCCWGLMAVLTADGTDPERELMPSPSKVTSWPSPGVASAGPPHRLHRKDAPHG